ncbi:hypothetical protein V5O48_009515 [Marasmius crinis-equi]|uniref:F-box domain-containing protein n=1 Tax=Marasmius crinis-equi TaxID=585013 RepID=A0ABR3FAX3_9AGAR
MENDGVSSAASTHNPAIICRECHFDFAASQNRIQGPPAGIYSQLSRRNACPSSQEEALVKGGMAEAKAQMSLVGDKITRLQAKIAALEAEKLRIGGIVEEYRSILRPVLRLPPELLSRIFSLASEKPATYDSRRPSSSLNPSKPPWVLSQVCQSWRALALDTPSLWSSVSFNFIPNRGSTLRAQSHRLQLQLQRSANHPLNITATTSTSNHTAIDRLLFPLCSSSPTWRHLSIELNDELFSPGLAPISGRLQALESLHLHFITSVRQDLGWFQFAPRLTRLSFSGDHRLGSSEDRHPRPNHTKLPFHQITHYSWQDEEGDISGIARGNLFAFSVRTLPLLLNVQSCRLIIHPDSIRNYIHNRNKGSLMATLQHLNELEVRVIGGGTGTHEVLSYITAPSLRRLTLSSSGPDQSALTDLFTNPETLTYLSISMIEMPPHDFRTVLARLTTLTDLSFGVVGGITDDYLSLFLSAQSQGSSHLPIVPNLRNLSLLATPNIESSYSEDILLGMLEARMGPEPGVGSAASQSYSRLFSVNLDKPVEGEAASQHLDELRVEGLRVGISGEE